MIKATIDAPNGRKLVVLGLSFANLDRFREEPRDTMIKIDGRELGLSFDIMIFSGETEDDLVNQLRQIAILLQFRKS